MGVGLFIDVFSPVFFMNEQQRTPVNISHLSKRFGFFFIILLGEILSSVVHSTQEFGVTDKSIIVSLYAIIIAFCMWWVYFENDNGPKVIARFISKESKNKKLPQLAGYMWAYSHLPLSLGIILVAIGLEKIILTPTEMYGSNPHFFSLVSTSAVISLLSIGTMQMSAISKENNLLLEHVKIILPFFSSIAILIFAGGEYDSTVGGFLLTILIICASQVLLQEFIEHRLHSHDHVL